MRSGPRRQRNRRSRIACAALPPCSRRRSIVDPVSVSSLAAARGAGIGLRPEPLYGDPSCRVGECAYLVQPPAQSEQPRGELRAGREVDVLERAAAVAARLPEGTAVLLTRLVAPDLVLEPAEPALAHRPPASVAQPRRVVACCRVQVVEREPDHGEDA